MRIAPDIHSRENYLHLIQYIFFTSTILYVGRDVFVLLSFALLIAFIVYPMCVWLERKRVPRMGAIVLSILLLLVLGSGFVALLFRQFVRFLNQWPTIQPKIMNALSNLSQTIMDTYSISKEQQVQWLKQLANDNSMNMVSYLFNIVSASSFSLVLLVLVPIFAMFILFYRHVLVSVCYRLFPDEKREDIRNILLLTVNTYYNFIKGMIVVYAVVGVLNSLGLYLLGVPNAILFGFTASILTFIPYVGIIVGSLLPITMAWLTYNSIWYPIGVVLIFTVVQYLEANLIFPLAVSSRLKINTLATLVAILVGGLLWGLSGMILFVPFVGILKLIADQHPAMKTWSILLGTESD